ncbi:MAG: hypothetical protein ABFS14_03040 [Gemmatimonadota bacterium]
MVTIASLWLVILLSAVAVWLASAVVWMVLPFHKSDFKAVSNEPAAREALKGLAPGMYNIPHMASWDDAKTPEGAQKFSEGPNAFLTVLPNRHPNMGKQLTIWFVFSLIVGTIVAYLASRTVAAGSDYLSVFRIAGTTAWLAYGMAAVQDAIWFGKPWSFVMKGQFDALLYGLLTAGVFGWLWPAA